MRALFRASRLGTIAGCMVTTGLVRRAAQVRVVRDGTVIYETTIASLRRVKDDVREVQEGFECGILLDNFNDDGLYLTLAPRASLPEEVRIFENIVSRVYTTLAGKARRVLTAGHSAVVDAVFTRPHERADIEAAAKGQQTKSKDGRNYN